MFSEVKLYISSIVLLISFNAESQVFHRNTEKIELIQVGIQLDSNAKNNIFNGIFLIENFYNETGRLSFDHKIKIRIFGDAKEYKDYRGSISTSLSDKGFYSQSRKESVINGSRPTVEMLKTIYHESSHAFMRSFAYKVPTWVDEGLAEYFEEIDTSGVSATASIQEWRYKRLQRLYGENKLMSIYESVNRSGKEWNKLGSEGYQDVRSISWSLFFHLMESPSGRMRIINMVRTFNPEKKYSSKLILQILAPQFSVITLEKEWREFIFNNEKKIKG